MLTCPLPYSFTPCSGNSSRSFTLFKTWFISNRIFFDKMFTLFASQGTRWPSWLRHCPTASQKTEYQQCSLEDQDGRCISLTILPPPCADCIEMCEPRPSGTPRACPGLYRNCFTVMTEHQDQCVQLLCCIH